MRHLPIQFSPVLIALLLPLASCLKKAATPDSSAHIAGGDVGTIKPVGTQLPKTLLSQSVTEEVIAVATEIGVWHDGFTGLGSFVVKKDEQELLRIPCTINAPDKNDYSIWKFQQGDNFYVGITTCWAQVDLSYMSTTGHAYGAYALGKRSGSLDCDGESAKVDCIEHVNPSGGSEPVVPLTKVSASFTSSGIHDVSMLRTYNQEPLSTLAQPLACISEPATKIGAMTSCSTGLFRIALDDRKNIDKDAPGILYLGNAEVHLLCRLVKPAANSATPKAQRIACRYNGK